MTDRAELLERFVEKSGWADAQRHALLADASGRSYIRLQQSDKTAILMNAPYEAGEDVRPFVKVTNMLRNRGLSAPEIYSEDVQNGFLLLEDLGNNLYATLCAENTAIESELYSAAIDTLLALHQTPVDDLPPYDMATYVREACLLTEWYLPTATGEQINSALNAEFRAIIEKACKPLISSMSALVMRDYHAENLIWLPTRSGTARVGLLDYQDALAGHPAYDLVSLLEDARRDTSSDLREDMIERYLAGSGVEVNTFTAAYNLLGMQRNLKIIGIFSRLSMRDGKQHYPDLIPRVWGHLQNDLLHPACDQMRDWVAKNVPAPSPEIVAKIKAAS